MKQKCVPKFQYIKTVRWQFHFVLGISSNSFCFNLCFHKASYLTTPHYHFDLIYDFGNFRNRISRLKTIFFLLSHIFPKSPRLLKRGYNITTFYLFSLTQKHTRIQHLEIYYVNNKTVPTENHQYFKR